jgi:hypothetical protein
MLRRIYAEQKTASKIDVSAKWRHDVGDGWLMKICAGMLAHQKSGACGQREGICSQKTPAPVVGDFPMFTRTRRKPPIFSARPPGRRLPQ